MAVQEPDLAAQTDAAAPSPLLLPSLEIKNFRAFRHLTIEKLGRVNLITGKNNVGKSSLLEALLVYAERGTPMALGQVLSARGEFRYLHEKAPDMFAFPGEQQLARPDVTSLAALLYGRPFVFEQKMPPIFIGSRGRQPSTLTVTLNLPESKQHTPRFEVETKFAKSSANVSLPYDDRFFENNVPVTGKVTCEMVSSNGLSDYQIGKLWDEVQLTPLEENVLEGLRLIVDGLDRVGLRYERSANGREIDRGRRAFAKIRGFTEPVPLASLGDGMNRMFGIMLAMVNSYKGFLLADEIENGVHYSVLPDVWRLIFQTARRLNVQVFATTHSWDCIEAFQKAAAEDDDPGSGVLVRLDNKGGNVSATVFDERRLAVVTREGIEVR